MNCLFCQKELADPTNEWRQPGPGPASSAGEVAFSEYECYNCSASFNVMDSVGQITDYSLKTDSYWAVFILTDNSFELAEVEFVGGFGPTYQRTKTILRFPFIPPNITPQNVAAKIKTLLTFS